jgi:hypothetical protein
VNWEEEVLRRLFGEDEDELGFRTWGYCMREVP